MSRDRWVPRTAASGWFKPPHSPVVGQVDHVSDRILRGWAWHPKTPRRRLGLDVFHRGIYLGHVSAGMHRPDLRAHGIGDGHHGFTFHLPDDVPDGDLDPADLCIATAGPRRWTLPLAADFGPSAPGRLLPSSFRDALGPYLRMLRGGNAPAFEGSVGPRLRIDTLCTDGPDRGVSAFVEHIACKYARSDLLSDDPKAFWSWYLGSYGMECGRRLAPLSAGDIARLSHVQPSGLSAAAELFCAPDLPDLRYEWALQADRLFVADCLVTPRDIEALRGTGATNAAYPLSAFMRLAKAELANLRSLASLTVRQRRRIYALFMILGLRNPSILSYLPGEWMGRLLEKGSEFEDTLAELFGRDSAIDGARYAALVRASGYDLVSQTFAEHRYQGHRVRGGPKVVTTPAPVDVQLFGPFERKMGLGESCRRLGQALEATRFSVNFVDYDIGSGSRLNLYGDLHAARPTRLNILHLNAEEIPEALVYLPDVFSQTPTVAMPYWELNRLSRAHLLGVATVDEVWTASRYLADIFAESGKTTRWVGMSVSQAPAPTELQRAALRTRLGLARETFVFLTTSDALSWVQRKNPLAVIEAFRSAFEMGSKVALIVKTHNLAGPLSQTQREHWELVRALCGADHRILLIDQSFDAADQRTLLAASDCLVSLHRAEGLGLDVLDALDLGTPVIATGHSGTSDFCTSETAWLVDFDLKPVGALDYSFVEPGHLWAEPRVASAIRAMRDVVADRVAREQRVRRGRELVSQTATERPFAIRIEDAVRAVLDA